MMKITMFKCFPTSRAVLAAVLISVPVLACAAPGTAESAYPMSPAVFKTLVVETVYPFSVAQYAPPVVVPSTLARAVPTTPEQVMFQLFASMKAADYDWNMALWTPASRLEMQQRHAKAGQGKAHYEAIWKQSRRSNYTLAARVTHGRFLIIQFEYDSPGAAKRQNDTIALEKQGEQWFLSQELAANPLLERWNAPGGRIQVAPDTMFKK